MHTCWDPTKPPWYALYTKPRHERKVSNHLVQDGFRTFFPQIERWSRRKDRKKRILAPLFPGYLFINAQLKGNNRLKVIKTNGVVRILGINAIPTAVPENQIEAIQKIVETNTVVYPHRYLKKGRTVKVVSGPLEGIEGIFLSEKGNGKLVVSVEILHRSVSVAIDESEIEPI